VIVPNTDLITNQVTNWTLTDRHARAIIWSCPGFVDS
jgi:small-conductance mechanosensitive channel